MFLWIAAVYVLSAVVFYSFIAATAQEDPHESAVSFAEATDRQWVSEQSQRKAA